MNMEGFPCYFFCFYHLYFIVISFVSIVFIKDILMRLLFQRENIYRGAQNEELL